MFKILRKILFNFYSNISGVFTVPKSGVWRVSYSLRFVIAGNNRNWAWLYHNGVKIRESEDYSGASDSWVTALGGRELLLKAEEGDSISFRTGEVYSEGLHDILKCVEFKAV